MDKEKEICLYLKKHHTGQENAVFSKELERLFSMNGRTIRRIISHLRQTGIPYAAAARGITMQELRARSMIPYPT